MEFRILGPLEVLHDDTPVVVPGAKPRALLGLLLVHANRVVSADRLAEELWEGTAPRSPEATLQTYVHRLRRGLATDSLRTRAGGYVLEVKDGELDALRFERAVREVSQVEDASPRWVALRLGEALAWWRGPALVDFAGGGWARTDAERLIRVTDTRPEAAHSVVLYGAFIAAIHEEWEVASRLLAAGERSIYRSPSQGHLYFHFRDRIRAALGGDRSRALRD
ncbi:MAG TPA: winged helix-turn-helix domain-containing protein, partial [Acidimicrobiales bacterium]